MSTKTIRKINKKYTAVIKEKEREGNKIKYDYANERYPSLIFGYH